MTNKNGLAKYKPRLVEIMFRTGLSEGTVRRFLNGKPTTPTNRRLLEQAVAAMRQEKSA